MFSAFFCFYGVDVEFLNNVWIVLSELAFWLLIGCFVSGVLHVLVSDNWLKKHLGGGGVGSVCKAVFVGVPMPLCSCGVIPAALGLKKQGAGNGASMGFLISTPQTGVDSIFVSASMLSWPFAIFKLVSAFLLGVIGGLISDSIESESEGAEDGSVREAGGKAGLLAVYDFAINDLLYMIWRWIVVGVVISAAITTWLPPGLLSDWSSYSLGLTLLAVLLFSLPLYVCATSSVPIAAALVDAGMPLSAALVFLMAGPATNVATIGAVYKGFGVKHLVNYLLTIVVGSLLLAYGFDFLLSDSIGSGLVHHHIEVGSYAVYLLLVFFLAFLVKDVGFFLKRFLMVGVEGSCGYQFLVVGLTCQGCVRKLTGALEAVDSVQDVCVDLDRGSVKLLAEPQLNQKIKDSVEKSGFRVKEFLN